jgi:hypothetical protein
LPDPIPFPKKPQSPFFSNQPGVIYVPRSFYSMGLFLGRGKAFALLQHLYGQAYERAESEPVASLNTADLAVENGLSVHVIDSALARLVEHGLVEVKPVDGSQVHLEVKLLIEDWDRIAEEQNRIRKKRVEERRAKRKPPADAP